MKIRKKANKNHAKTAEEMYNMNNMASATECTGLISAPPQSDADAAEFSDMYGVPKQKK